jgi:gluconolactonase
MKKFTVYLFSTFVLSLNFCFAQESISIKGLTAKNEGLVLAGSGYRFTEGPAVHRNGDVFFTDQPNNQILKWESITGKITPFHTNSGRSNGLFFDQMGNLIACADEKNELWSFDPKGNATVLISNFKNQRLNGPNDLWIAPNGGMYITDPLYERPYWEGNNQPRVKGENLFYYSADKTQFFVVDAQLVKPNGIIGTPDGKKLYVADIGDKKTYQYEIEEDGYLKNKKMLIPMGSDGMTIDNRGNIYLTGDGVTIFDAKGKKIGHIPVKEGWTSNVCFGGSDRKTLFITALGSVYTLPMKVRGVF